MSKPKIKVVNHVRDAMPSPREMAAHAASIVPTVQAVKAKGGRISTEEGTWTVIRTTSGERVTFVPTKDRVRDSRAPRVKVLNHVRAKDSPAIEQALSRVTATANRVRALSQRMAQAGREFNPNLERYVVDRCADLETSMSNLISKYSRSFQV